MPFAPAAPVPLALLAAALAGIVGALAGLVVRRGLARLRRPAAVPVPWCEAGTGLLWSAVLLAAGLGLLPWPAVPPLLVLGVVAVAGSATDLTHRRLPDALTLPALPAVGLALLPSGVGAVLRAAAGAVLLGGAYAAVHLAAPAALGAGDVKLAGPVGAALAGTAWQALLPAVLATAVASALVAVLAVGLGRAGRGTGLPHGPVLLAVAWATVLAAAVRG